MLLSAQKAFLFFFPWVNNDSRLLFRLVLLDKLLLFGSILVEPIILSLFEVGLARFLFLVTLRPAPHARDPEEDETKPDPEEHAQCALEYVDVAHGVMLLLRVPVFEWCIERITFALATHLLLILIKRCLVPMMMVALTLLIAFLPVLILVEFTVKLFPFPCTRLLSLIHIIHVRLKSAERVLA
jgi:hypothetical protein